MVELVVLWVGKGMAEVFEGLELVWLLRSAGLEMFGGFGFGH